MENMTELITVTQLPVIEEQLKSVKQRFETAVDEALAMDCNEETLKAVRARRAELTKVYSALETKRKEAKAAILAPYESFESIYRECVTDIYGPCDRKLAERIHGVENELKSQKEADVRAYFCEYATAQGVQEIAEYELAGINVTLSASKKSLREKAKEYIDSVKADLDAIEASEDRAELMAEYCMTRSLPAAISAVQRRHAAIAAERERIAREEERKAAGQIAREKVEAVVEEEEIIVAPVEIEPEAVQEDASRPVEDEKRFTVEFTVTGTLNELRALKAFLEERNYKYEC